MTEVTSGAGIGGEDDFEALLAESFISQDHLEGRVVHGSVVAIDGDNVVIDVGLKTEGRISVREFGKLNEEVAVGDNVEVFLERIENALGDAVISQSASHTEKEEALRKKSIKAEMEVHNWIEKYDKELMEKASKK